MSLANISDSNSLARKAGRILADTDQHADSWLGDPDIYLAIREACKDPVWYFSERSGADYEALLDAAIDCSAHIAHEVKEAMIDEMMDLRHQIDQLGDELDSLT